MVEMEKEVQVILQVMVDIIPIDLVVDMMVPMAPQLGVISGPTDDPYGGGSDTSFFL